MRNVLGGTRKLKAGSDIFNTIFQVLLRLRFSRSAQGGRIARVVEPVVACQFV